MLDERIDDIVELEQNIMSGVESERLESLSPDAILKQVMDFSKGVQDRPEILLRITALLLTYYEIPDKNY